MQDREFIASLRKAAREQGLDPDEVVQGFEAGRGLPDSLGLVLVRAAEALGEPPGAEERTDSA